ncbi:hypothetical protein NL676_008164 [Syzygium grande]|nr:hypothetical protein NL676_008164 [Syzygium grande]
MCLAWVIYGDRDLYLPHRIFMFRHVTFGQSQTAYRPPRYGIQPSDFVHAATSMAVYAVLVLSDRSVMDTLYPHASRRLRSLLQWARLVAVIFSALLSLIFPTYRRGIGFAVFDAANSRSSDEDRGNRRIGMVCHRGVLANL